MKSAQAKTVRRRLVAKTLLALGLFAAVYWLFVAFAGHGIYQQAGYLYADVFSPWTYIDENTYNALKQAAETGDVDTLVQNAPLVYSSWLGSGEISIPTDLGFWSDGNLYAVRSLVGYNAFMHAETLVCLALFFIGCLVIGLVMLCRSARYLDDLCCAVTKMLEDSSRPIELPDSLAAIRGELSAIQLRNLSDRNAAQMAEQRKNEIVAYLAHDIRTPLTSVIGYLELLREAPDLPAEQRARYTGIAYDKALYLEGLVSEFFDITRYNLQSIPIERENVDLALFCSQVADEFYPEAQERELVLTVDAPEGEGVFIDPEKMARALGNVLRNALAYADAASEVKVSAEIRDMRARIQVTDQGKEISEAHLQSIFDKFYREESARPTGEGGTGLGLAIAKEIVEAHGGTISATSEKGTTTFTIEVPR